MADGRNWTPEQQQVIRLRGRNILVSAAAGSGKTAVLVERILKKITDLEHPVEVDHLLVVTFTRAAASEMRERIGDAIEAALCVASQNGLYAGRLIKQATLLHSAQISTIDSFCKKIVEEHFHDIDLDPVFRVADEAELLLMREDVCEKMLEDYYEENSPEFREFAEMYASGKDDSALEDMILKLYHFAESYPDPEQWLAKQEKEYREDVEQKRFHPVLLTLLCQMIEGAELLCQKALAICHDMGGPLAYEGALLSDQEMLAEIRKAADCGDFMQVRQTLTDVHHTALSRKKQEGVEEEKKEQVKGLRNQIKKTVKELEETFFFGDLSTQRADYEATIPGVRMLLHLTADFRRRFTERKRKNNLLDFSDLEHLALQVLREPDGKPTAAAREYQEFYEEILIDEYQDSNRIQELLLTSISRITTQAPNQFMVGDVKQSIYKFRQARPELFMEKYRSYTKEDSLYQKIDLHKNFRSRAQVLDVTNQVFSQIMHRSLGGVEYDADAALYLGAEYQELSPGEEKKMQPEILLLDADSQGEKAAGRLNAKEQEAILLAHRIRKLHEEGIAYGDIVILLRTMSGWSEVFLEMLNSEGIPAVCDTSSGYFSAWEVQVMLNLLRILDNPRQDIPLASVLLSPIGGMTPEDLAQIRILADYTETKEKRKRGGLYEALLCAADEKNGEEYTKKSSRFLTWLEKKRHTLIFTPVHELIRQMLSESGFYRYVSAMPAGRTRAANLDMLVEKAESFEQTSYHGLFHFVRYIEKLHKYEVDYGEAGTEGEGGEVVRIMSIHKSKGLEFRVVFVAGMAKRFNQQDARSTIVLHPDFGIGVDFVDLKLRQKGPTLAKKTLQKQLLQDTLGEELRILYVAFTRAREKLILTGVVQKLEKKKEKWASQVVSDLSVMKATNYLDLVMPVILQEKPSQGKHRFALYFLTMGDLTVQEMLAIESRRKNLEAVYHLAGYAKGEKQKELLERMKQELSWQYPYAEWQKRKGKITVSELKRLHLTEEEAGEGKFQEPITEKLWEPVIPDFAKEEIQVEGAIRGTLYHYVLEKLPFLRITGKEDLLVFLDDMLREGKLTKEEREALNIRKLMRFLEDPLTERIRQAEVRGKLHRESPFVLGVAANQIYPELHLAEETILVQGIIDIWFEEEDGIVLLDYKTDFVGEKGAEKLVERYHLQLDYYQKALEQLTGYQVKEKRIYSFSLGQSIRLP